MKKRRQMKRHMDDDQAVVGIVTAILLVGLLVTVFSIVQTVYVPEWMEEIEKEHMDEISAQFAELKHTLDLQLYTSSKSHIPVTTPITLGSGNVPFFLSQHSSGYLHIKNNQCAISISADNQTDLSLGTIIFESKNSYFTNQHYIFESGAVFLNQSEGSLLVSQPFFTVQNEDNITIRFTLVNISSRGGKTSLYGSNTCGILTNFSSEDTMTCSNVSELSITTSNLNPWFQYINQSLSDQGLTSTHYLISKGNDEISVDFRYESSPKNVTIILEVITINAQIAPGWIK